MNCMLLSIISLTGFSNSTIELNVSFSCEALGLSSNVALRPLFNAILIKPLIPDLKS